MKLTGGAAERLEPMLPPGTEAFIHLTLTDEKAYAQAFVVIEARPALSCPDRSDAQRPVRASPERPNPLREPAANKSD